MGAILDDEDAEGAAGPEDRHAEEGVERLLAGLRLVGEGRVRLGVGEVEEAGFLGDQADEAFANAHDGVVHRVGVEADGGVELKDVVGAQDT